MINKNTIPKHWEIKLISDIGEIVSGGTPSTKELSYWNGNISWITPADLSGYTEKRISKGKKSITENGLKNSSARLMPAKSVLFSSRAPIGYVAIASNELCTNQGFKSIIPNESIDAEFLYYYLKTAKNIAENAASGTTFKEISSKNFSKLEIPLPPPSEQQQIVSKIEELFSELDKGKQQLETIKQQLKTYRQAVLKWAFEGRLTVKTGRDLSRSTENKNSLPEGWKWVKFIDFCKLQRGYDLPLKEITEGIYPLVTSSGIKGYHNEFRANGPCLITGRSGGVGNIHYMDTKKYWPHNTVLFVKDFCGNYPKYMYYFFLQFNFKSFGASTTIPTLDRKQLYNELVSLPPIEEQKDIVTQIETRLSVCDKMEESVETALQQAESLRQSILKQAFEGKLIKPD